MSARAITQALGGRWHGRYGTARCPCHEDHNPSLSVSDGDAGRLLVNCHAGCDGAEVLRVLNGRGLGANSTANACSEHGLTGHKDNARHALEIWRGALPVEGTLAETYLRERGITLPVPPSLRYAGAIRHSGTGLYLPAMIAGVQAPDRKVCAVHRTFLNARGRKASVTSPKMALGPLGTGAVRLARAGPVLGLTEGIEDALAAMQLCEVPVWAVLGGNRLGRVDLPPEVREVRVFADGDEAGREAAEKAVRRYRRAGLTARAFLPPDGAKDFAEVLTCSAS